MSFPLWSSFYALIFNTQRLTEHKRKKNKFRFLEILELIKITSLFSWTVFVFFIFVVSVVVHWCFHTFFRFERESRFFLIHIGLINNGKKPLIFVLCLVFAVVLEILLCRFLFSFIGFCSITFIFILPLFHPSSISRDTHTHIRVWMSVPFFPCRGPWNFRKI